MHIIALLKDTEREANEIARAMRKVKGLVAAKLEQQGDDEVSKRHHTLMARMMKLQEMLAFELTDQNIDNLLQFREAVAMGLENPTDEDRRCWLDILQTKVTVTGGVAVIACRLGGKVRYRLNEIELHQS